MYSSGDNYFLHSSAVVCRTSEYASAKGKAFSAQVEEAVCTFCTISVRYKISKSKQAQNIKNQIKMSINDQTMFLLVSSIPFLVPLVKTDDISKYTNPNTCIFSQNHVNPFKHMMVDVYWILSSFIIDRRRWYEGCITHPRILLYCWHYVSSYYVHTL